MRPDFGWPGRGYPRLPHPTMQPMLHIPKPPHIESTKLNIEKIAEFVFKNGQAFEEMTRQKNANNPNFQFLYAGGEFSEFYQFVLYCYRQGLNLNELLSNAAAPHDGAPLDDDRDGGSREIVEYDLEQLVVRYRVAPVDILPENIASELQDVMASLWKAVEEGRAPECLRKISHWVQVNSQHASQIAAMMCHKLYIGEVKTFDQGFGVLSFVDEVIEADRSSRGKEGDSGVPLSTFLAPYLVWMLRAVHHLTSLQNATQHEMVVRLMDKWENTYQLFKPNELKEMKILISAKELQVPHFFNQSLPDQVIEPTIPVAEPPPTKPPRRSRFDVVGPPPEAQHIAQYGARPPPPPMMINQPIGNMHTPETIPVGMMCTLLIRLSKSANTSYTAVDPQHTPQAFPPMETPSERLLQRVKDFYGDVAEDEENEKRETRKKKQDFESSPLNMAVKKASRRERWDDMSEDPKPIIIDLEPIHTASTPDAEMPMVWAQAEAGLKEDGTLKEQSSEGRLGIGHRSNDEYEEYRKSRAQGYHVFMAEKQKERTIPGQEDGSSS
eukprot:Platyproteum_vivax@DN6155_c0_g1_i1.p1